MAKILIVDDQKSVLLTLEALLSKEGHVVTARENSRDAIDALSREPFDLMITDAIMPGSETGYALIRTVRLDPKLSRLPIVLLTGKREKADVEKGIQSGADDYIVKPVDPEILFAKIAHLLDRSAHQKTTFAEAPAAAKGVWDTKTEIISVSELGLTIRSGLAVPLGSLQKLDSPLFEEIGIPRPILRIVACDEHKTPEPHFVVQSHFVGLSEKELMPLRLWIRAKKSF
ncbi:MAG: response regulator [Bdellovibrionaceae bacterium]|nr:response regulator [Pseudobdellovibrionaceae bacterium]MBX3033268.1 response regulator [Pseudobdellovibrionaceae bacterium]